MASGGSRHSLGAGPMPGRYISSSSSKGSPPGGVDGVVELCGEVALVLVHRVGPELLAEAFEARRVTDLPGEQDAQPGREDLIGEHEQAQARQDLDDHDEPRARHVGLGERGDGVGRHGSTSSEGLRYRPLASPPEDASLVRQRRAPVRIEQAAPRVAVRVHEPRRAAGARQRPPFVGPAEDGAFQVRDALEARRAEPLR